MAATIMSAAGIVYGKGFYEEERDDFYLFRWMSGSGELTVPADEASRNRFLTLPVFSEMLDFSQVLTVRRGGRVLAEFALLDHWNLYDVPLVPEGAAGDEAPAGSDANLTLSLNKLVPKDHCPDETRPLGVRIGPPELHDDEERHRSLQTFRLSADGVVYGKGFYKEEKDEFSRYRWMCGAGELTFPATESRGRYLALPVHSKFRDSSQVLTVRRGGRVLAELALLNSWNYYDIPLVPEGGPGDVAPAGSDLTVTLSLNKLASPAERPSRERPLGVRVGPPEIHDDEGRHRKLITVHEKAGDFLYGRDFSEEEKDDFTRFRWMPGSAELTIAAEATSRNRFLTLLVFSEFRNFSQVLTVRRGGRVLAELALLDHWNYYDVPLVPEGGPAEGKPVGSGAILTFSLNKLIPRKYYASDVRPLGIRIGPPELHDDETLHRNLRAFHRNAMLNYREMTEGKTVLESTPLNLGIDIYGKCNINPHCVYCLWDSMKVLEGDNIDTPVDARTLEGYGPFFTTARTLVNCSFGEPLLHPKLTELLEFCARNKKIVELATNGQAFTERTIKALVGKPIYLYISLDAASKATYAKIRNDRWDEILPGLRRLGEERRKAGNLPRIFMVFIPMRVNQDDLEEYFKLCLVVGADALVLRPMLFLTRPNIVEERGGHVFNYGKEMLNRREVEDVIRKAGEFSKLYGVPLASQFDFGLMKEPAVEKEGNAP